jgi:2-polyprenyl-3-methyl-5-hydroxy-6-metoxy-1,4-benzoquinol methylase
MRNFLKKLVKNLFFRFTYLRTPPWDTGITPPELEEFIATHPPGRAIDLGCGTGTNAITLAKHGWLVTGLDFVPRAIRQARRKAQIAGLDIQFRVGDVTDPNHFQGQYDLIYDIGCFHSINLAKRPLYHELIARHLSPGGTYMLYGYLNQINSHILDSDIAAFQSLLTLTRREDSYGRLDRPTAWFWFESKV